MTYLTILTLSKNKRARTYKLGLMVLVFCTSVLQGQEAWELKQDKNGIAIYSRSSDFSAFNEFRATTKINSSVHAFVSVLKDIDRIPDWMHSVKSSRFLEKTGDSIQIYYTEAKAPFPLKNRDGIYLNRFIWETTTKKLHVDIEVLPDYLEIDDDMVRISQGRGFWEAQQITSDTIAVTFQMQVDPGGSIPSWMANMFVVDTPFQTLTKLKKIISDKKYADSHYDFMD